LKIFVDTVKGWYFREKFSLIKKVIMQTSGKFKFDGDVASYFGVGILSFCLILFTFGLGLPWAICMKQSWVTKNTTIDGRRLKFMGSGGELFGKFIVWWFLTFVTLGIYSLWVGPKLQKWLTEYTDFE
jgi:uncharacterized membrane protein YjgN (DUF898 family)